MAELQDDNLLMNFKQKFEEKFLDIVKQQKGNKCQWTESKIVEIINCIKSVKAGTCKGTSGYYWSNKYEIMTTANGESLIFKRKNPDAPPVVVIPREQFFDVLTEIHESTGHGGRDKMNFYIKPKMYIPRNAIEIFLSLCPKCANKHNRKFNQSRSKEKTTIGQFHVHDFQSLSNDEYKWLLNYQDDSSKFTSLRPLQSIQANDVALELLKIFLTYGPPDILQSDSESVFTLQVVAEINSMWPQCKLQYGILESQINHEDTESMLQTWMNDNKSNNWRLGCYFVQYLKNTSLNSNINTTPYKALFGRDPKTMSSETLTDESTVEKPIKTESIDAEIEEIQLSDDEPIDDADVNINVDAANMHKVKSVQPNLTCIVCQTEASAETGAHKCMTCKSVHVICGLTDENEMSESTVVCFVCNRSIESSKNTINKGVKRTFEKDTENTIKKSSSSTNRISTVSDKERDPLSSIPVTFDPGYFQTVNRCGCKQSDNQCQNNRCACYKNSVPCGPKCHSQTTCLNV